MQSGKVEHDVSGATRHRPWHAVLKTGEGTLGNATERCQRCRCPRQWQRQRTRPRRSILMKNLQMESGSAIGVLSDPIFNCLRCINTKIKPQKRRTESVLYELEEPLQGRSPISSAYHRRFRRQDRLLKNI
uniref:Uncharacterized protein n=1 Tax=Haemonchus contortus TaxID=6289 RepID=A0A7I5EDA7_HAECO